MSECDDWCQFEGLTAALHLLMILFYHVPGPRQSCDGAQASAILVSVSIVNTWHILAWTVCKLRSFLNDADHQVISLGQLVLDKHPERHKWCQFDGMRSFIQYRNSTVSHSVPFLSTLLSRPDVAESVIPLLWSDLTAQKLVQILGEVCCVHQCLAQVFPGRIRKHWQRCFSGNWWSRMVKIYQDLVLTVADATSPGITWLNILT